MAWSMGWDAAMVPYLAEMLDDPYGVVRFISHRSLRRHPGFADFEFDSLGPEGQSEAARARALELWNAGDISERTLGDAVLVGRDGNLQRQMFAELLRQRDHRPIYLAE